MIQPDNQLPWPIAWPAVLEIARSESCRLKAYRCPAGVWTIGWGRTKGVQPGDTCTQEQADAWLLEDLTEFAAGVKAALQRPASLHELGAMVSLAYNIGLGGFRGSTVLRKHNAGDPQAAADAFRLWNKARVSGVLTVLPGLVARRAREAALYLTPDDDEPERIAQAVATEDNPLKHSRTLAGSVVGGLAAVVGAIHESAGDVIAQATAAVGPLGALFGGDHVQLLVFGLIAAGFGAVAYARVDDWRRKGR